jgi:hypothetical protein
MNRSVLNFKWIRQVQSILNNTGNTYFWLNQNLIENRNIHKKIKRCLIDQFYQTWSGLLRNSSKGRNYMIFKDAPIFEPYLKLLPYNQRINLFHFKTGNHWLPVETGRWHQSFVEHDQRKCTL